MVDTVQLNVPDRSAPSAARDRNRAVKAAHDFEALLLGSLLESMQQGLSGLPGEPEKPAGFGDYGYMANQAIAAAISAGGGVGIAQLLLKHLTHS